MHKFIIQKNFNEPLNFQFKCGCFDVRITCALYLIRFKTLQITITSPCIVSRKQNVFIRLIDDDTLEKILIVENDTYIQ